MRSPIKLWRAKEQPHAVRLASWRLRDAQICRRDAIKLMRKCDDDSVLFYADPPYEGTHCSPYASGGGEGDNAELLDFLSATRAKFVMSEYHSERLQRMAAKCGWSYRVMTMGKHSANGRAGGGVKKQEAVLWNFTPVCGDDAIGKPPVLPLLAAASEGGNEG